MERQYSSISANLCGEHSPKRASGSTGASSNKLGKEAKRTKALAHTRHVSNMY